MSNPIAIKTPPLAARHAPLRRKNNLAAPWSGAWAKRLTFGFAIASAVTLTIAGAAGYLLRP